MKNKDFTNRFESLKLDVIKHIEELCENWYKIDLDDLHGLYTIAWSDGAYSYIEDMTSFCIKKDDDGIYKYFYESIHESGIEYKAELGFIALSSLIDILDRLH